MFCITQNNKILITKGDNAEIDIRVFNKEGKEIEILPSDVITMVVKKTSTSQSALTKVAQLNSIFLVPEDTANLTPGLYDYDIQFERDNEIQTIVPCSIFEIREEIA